MFFILPTVRRVFCNCDFGVSCILITNNGRVFTKMKLMKSLTNVFFQTWANLEALHERCLYIIL